MPDDIEELTRLRVRVAELEAENRKLRLAGVKLLAELRDVKIDRAENAMLGLRLARHLENVQAEFDERKQWWEG